MSISVFQKIVQNKAGFSSFFCKSFAFYSDYCLCNDPFWLIEDEPYVAVWNYADLETVLVEVRVFFDLNSCQVGNEPIAIVRFKEYWS